MGTLGQPCPALPTLSRLSSPYFHTGSSREKSNEMGT